MTPEIAVHARGPQRIIGVTPGNVSWVRVWAVAGAGLLDDGPITEPQAHAALEAAGVTRMPSGLDWFVETVGDVG